MEYKPIGIIHTPLLQIEEIPLQPAGASGATGYGFALHPEGCIGVEVGKSLQIEM